MKTIPTIISREYVQSLSASDLREILENASEKIIDQIISLLPTPSEEDYQLAHQYLDDGIYDEKGNLIGEKHPDD